MNGRGNGQRLTLRVIAYHGEPHDVGGIPTRDKVLLEEHVPIAEVINDPFGPIGPDPIDELIQAFQQSEHDCKVNYLDDGSSGTVREFDVFEPSYDDAMCASLVAAALMAYLLEHVRGYPTGR